MNQFLLPEERQQLKKQYRQERDAKKSDRLKSILCADSGKTYTEIAEVLQIHETTVRRHVDDYIASKKKSNSSGGSEGKLTPEQKLDFQRKLASVSVPNVAKAIAMAVELYEVTYSTSGMTDLLRVLCFSYKKSEGFRPKMKRSAKKLG